MDPKIKADWVRALRSGEYEQGEWRFEQDGKLCCLGVLCKAVLKVPTMLDGGSNWGALEGILPDRQIVILYEMNDGSINRRVHTFSEIADYIEENL